MYTKVTRIFGWSLEYSLTKFRLLPPVCRQIILHALWSHHPLRVTDVKLLLQMDVHAPLEEWVVFRGVKYITLISHYSDVMRS